MSRATVAERLDRRSTPEPNSGCTLWLGSLDQAGYGHIVVDGSWSPQGVHRISYQTFVGPIPDGLHIDHLCANRSCINPVHLEPVTPAENNRRAYVRSGIGNRMTCKNGHPVDAATTYINKRGHRYCRPCNQKAVKQYQTRAREQAR